MKKKKKRLSEQFVAQLTRKTRAMNFNQMLLWGAFIHVTNQNTPGYLCHAYVVLFFSGQLVFRECFEVSSNCVSHFLRHSEWRFCLPQSGKRNDTHGVCFQMFKNDVNYNVMS